MDGGIFFCLLVAKVYIFLSQCGSAKFQPRAISFLSKGEALHLMAINPGGESGKYHQDTF